jgi:hypothetical protein
MTTRIIYRLIVGEAGSDLGHIVHTQAKSLPGARRALRRAMAPYDGDGWGHIESQEVAPGEHVQPDEWYRC